MTCINCCCPVTNMERNTTENVNIFLISVFGNVLHSNSTVLNDIIAICDNCNSYAKHLLNCRNNFLEQTKPESIISQITEQEARVKKCFELNNDVPNNEEFITCDFEAPRQSQKEIIVQRTERNSQEEDLNEEIISDNYNEKILELKIQKLQLTELHQKHLPKTVKPVHTCEKCCRNFSSKVNLQNHVKIVHTSAEFNFSCPFCEKSFSYYWFYKKHLKVNHCGVEMTFSCSICRKVVHSQKELDQHNFSAHKITSHPFKCNFCDVAFETVKEIKKLRNHLVECHGDSKEAEAARINVDYIMERQKWKKSGKPCNFCGKFIKDTLARTVHILFEHQDHRACQSCKETFDSEEDFHDHIQSTGHRLNTCAVCGKGLRGPDTLLRHWQNAHMVKRFRFSCEICRSSFYEFHQLRSHYKYHSVKARPRQFSCNQCGKLFTLKSQLQYHMAVHSFKNNESDELLKCKYCETSFKGFRRNNYLRKHIYKFHTEELQKETTSTFKCLEPECGLVFLTIQSFHLHKRKHGLSDSCRNPKPGHVDQTSKNLVKQFVTHDVTLDTIESVKCEVCGGTYMDKYKLKRHMAALHKDITTPGHADKSDNIYMKPVIKDGVRKFQCGLCEIVLSRRCHLHRHLFSQHAVKFDTIKYDTIQSVNCKVCGKNLKGKYHLKRHMSSFHKGNSVFGDRIKQLQQYKCTLCDAIFFGTYGIRDHFLTSHPDTPGGNAAANNIKRVKEDNAMGIYGSIQALVQNDSIAKIENYCKPCNNLFPTISDKYAHDCQHHKTFLRCKTCKDEFGSEKNLKKHQSSHSILNCHHCVSVFDCVEDYHEHLQTKHTLQPYICEFCGLFFSNKLKIWSHYRVHSNNQSETDSSKNKTKAKCEVCGNIYRDKYGLKRHMAATAGATTPVPGLSQNVESSKNLITEMINDGFKKFQCGLCQIVMSRKYHLHRHLFRKHAVKFESLKYGSVENVKCEICDKILKGNYQLKNHMDVVHQVNHVSAENQNNLKSQPIGAKTRCSSRIRQKKPIAYCSTESDSSSSE